MNKLITSLQTELNILTIDDDIPFALDHIAQNIMLQDKYEPLFTGIIGIDVISMIIRYNSNYKTQTFFLSFINDLLTGRTLFDPCAVGVSVFFWGLLHRLYFSGRSPVSI